MSTITLESIQTKQSELTKMIQQFQAQAASGTTIEIADAIISLAPGEHYAGAVLSETGQHKHHLVLMAQKPDQTVNWKDATGWAKNIGGALPTRQELALIYANCKPHLQPEWHWSSEVYENDASFAWFCIFYDGGQYGILLKSYEGSAVAVRRV